MQEGRIGEASISKVCNVISSVNRYLQDEGLTTCGSRKKSSSSKIASRSEDLMALQRTCAKCLTGLQRGLIRHAPLCSLLSLRVPHCGSLNLCTRIRLSIPYTQSSVLIATYSSNHSFLHNGFVYGSGIEPHADSVSLVHERGENSTFVKPRYGFQGR